LEKWRNDSVAIDCGIDDAATRELTLSLAAARHAARRVDEMEATAHALTATGFKIGYDLSAIADCFYQLQKR
jgi:hypothetical protein